MSLYCFSLRETKIAPNLFNGANEWVFTRKFHLTFSWKEKEAEGIFVSGTCTPLAGSHP